MLLFRWKTPTRTPSQHAARSKRRWLGVSCSRQRNSFSIAPAQNSRTARRLCVRRGHRTPAAYRRALKAACSRKCECLGRELAQAREASREIKKRMRLPPLAEEAKRRGARERQRNALQEGAGLPKLAWITFPTTTRISSLYLMFLLKQGPT